MRHIEYALVAVIRVYQKVFSPDRGLFRYLVSTPGVCVMYPSCSEYMVGAIHNHGPILGVWRGVRRLLRCHPYQKQLIDLP